MTVALFFRTLIAAAYLLALGWNDPWQPRNGMLAAAIVAVWALPLLRDGKRRPAPQA
jgi:hypothetical protein